VTPLVHDEIEELLGAYALNAVDAEEATLVEQHLQGCPRCRSEVAGHREVATVLGNTGGDAPAGLWDRISIQLEEAPPPMRLDLPGALGTVTPLAPRRRERTRGFVVAAMGAAAALAIGVLGAQVVRQQDQLDRFEAAIEDGSLLSAANVALRDPDATKADLTSADGTVTVTAVVLPDGTGYLMANDLPGLEDGRTYQLWGQTSSGLISLGLLGGAPGAILPFEGGTDLAALAVTAEQSGGVVQSENPAVVIGELG
jgi:hypothetical protein